MKILAITLILIGLVNYSDSKKQTKVIQAQNLTNKNTKFLSKFDVGEGTGYFKVKIKKNIARSTIDNSNINLRVGILQDAYYSEFMTAQSCQQKQQLYYDTRQLFFIRSNTVEIVFDVIETQSQGYWYLYTYDCESETDEYNKLPYKTFKFDLEMKNNGSWFGQDQNLIPEYVFVTLLWLAFTVQYSIRIIQSIRETKQNIKYMVFFSFFFLILSYLYRIGNLLVISVNGNGESLLDYLADIIKHIVEGNLVGAILSIAWGWSVISLDTSRISIFLGIFMAVFNIICSSIWNDSDTRQIHQHYNPHTWRFLLGLRAVLFCFLLIGSLRTISKSGGKIKLFMERFSFWGAIYLLGWPIGLFICQILLPKQTRKQAMVLFQESISIIGNGSMCHAFAIATSEYKKVDKENQSILPD